MKIITIAIIFAASAFSAYGECISSPKDYMKKVAPGSEFEVYKFIEHIIYIPKDSCGAKGCEIFGFSPKSSKCSALTLNEKGVLLPETLKRGHIGIRIKGKLRSFKYDLRFGAFK